MKNRIKNIFKEREIAIKAVNELTNDIEKIKLDIHIKLDELGFYDDCILNIKDSDKTIQDFYAIQKHKLPYKYAGEGDFYNITIELESDNIVISHFCSFRSDLCSTLAYIPYEIYESNNLIKFIDELCEGRKNSRATFQNEEKMKKKKRLEEELKNLK